MPKRKSKEKKHKLRTPPLSPWDKVIYPLVIAAGLGGLLGIALGGPALAKLLAHADPTVLVTARTMKWASLLLALFFAVTAFLPIAIMFRMAKGILPIFARSDITYGREGGYNDLFPMFGKCRTASADTAAKVVREQEKDRRDLKKSLIGVLVTLLLFPLTLFGRSDLHEDMSVTIRNPLNMETARYEAEDVEGVTFSIDSYLSGYRVKVRHLDLRVTLEMADGREYSFTADPETLLLVSTRFPRGMTVCRANVSVEEYIRRKNLDEPEAAALRALFG